MPVDILGLCASEKVILTLKAKQFLCFLMPHSASTIK